jgi:hypothetical protein
MEILKRGYDKYEEMKCIWMSSGVISYKLCGREFNCENCLFHKAMLNTVDIADFDGARTSKESGLQADLLDERINLIESVRFNNAVAYLDNCFVVSRLGENTFIIGFNEVATGILKGESEIHFGKFGKQVNEGEVFFTLSGRWGSKVVKAPVSLIIIDRLNNFTGLNDNYYWIAVTAAGSLFEEHRMPLSRLEKQKSAVSESLKKIREQFSLIGGSMHDGGQRLNNLHEIIGLGVYNGIVSNLIN